MGIYRRKSAGFFAVLAVFLFTVVLFLGVFIWYGRSEVRIVLGKEYYFLVRDCEDTTASAVSGEVYLAGGAGYLLGGDCVVLSCYFRIEDAERVQSTMAERGIETRILTLGTEDFTLRGADTVRQKTVISNAETAETCARILYDAANGLERTELSQDGARAAVRGVVKSLKGLRLGNEGDFFLRWNAVLSAAERRGTELSAGILFAKDLRYLETQLLLAVVDAAACFS